MAAQLFLIVKKIFVGSNWKCSVMSYILRSCLFFLTLFVLLLKKTCVISYNNNLIYFKRISVFISVVYLIMWENIYFYNIILKEKFYIIIIQIQDENEKQIYQI